MPTRPGRACNSVGCAEIVRDGHSRCPAHRREREQRRGSSSQRGYGSAWREIRDRFIRENPLCIFCQAEGRIVPATDVDHIIAKRDGGRDEWSNLRSLCHACHSRRTVRDNGGFAR